MHRTKYELRHRQTRRSVRSPACAASGLARDRRQIRPDNWRRHVRARRSEAVSTILRAMARPSRGRGPFHFALRRTHQWAVTDPWIDKYIFREGYLPTLTQIAGFSADAGLYVLDVENLKQHYVRTLDQWRANFTAMEDQIQAIRGPEFTRMWSLYLHGSLAAFRWGDLQLWQTVLAKDDQHAWPLDRQIDRQPVANSCGQPSMNELAGTG